MNRVDMIPATVIACCVLHNICIDSGDDFLNKYINKRMNDVQNEREEITEIEDREIGNSRRDALVIVSKSRVILCIYVCICICIYAELDIV